MQKSYKSVNEIVALPMYMPLNILSFRSRPTGNLNKNERIRVLETTSQILNVTLKGLKEIKIGPKIQYRVYVQTGDKPGAGTDANIKIQMFGTKGKSGIIELTKSKTSQIPFQRNKHDIFDLENFDIGDLKAISIGHTEKDIRYSWFLDSVSVEDFNNNVKYEFLSNQWFSEGSSDKRSVRTYLPTYVTNIVNGTKLDLNENAQFTELEINEKKDENANVFFVPAKLQSNKPVPKITASLNRCKSVTSTVKAQFTRSSVMTEELNFRRDNNASRVSAISRTISPSPRSSIYSSISRSSVVKQRELYLSTSSEDTTNHKYQPYKPRSTIDTRSFRYTHSRDHDSILSSTSSSLTTSSSTFTRRNDGDAARRYEESRSSSSLSSSSSDYTEKNLLANLSHKGSNNDLNDESAVLPVITVNNTATPSKVENLVHLIITNKLDELKDELRTQPDLLFSTNHDHQSLLAIACQAGHEDIVRYLIEQNQNLITVKSHSGYLPVHYCAKYNRLSCLKILIEYGAQLDVQTSDGLTALHLAVLGGHYEVCKCLIEQKANTEIKDIHGRTPSELSHTYNVNELKDLMVTQSKELDEKYPRLNSNMSNKTMEDMDEEQELFNNVEQNRKITIKSPYLRPKGPSPTESSKSEASETED